MKLTTKKISNYNLFFLFTSIVWTPVQMYYLHIDGYGRIPLLLSFIALLLNIRGKKNNSINNSAFLLWTMLTLYSFINSMIKGYDVRYDFFMFLRANFLEPYVFLFIALIEFGHDKNRCMKVILIAQLIYMFFGATHIVFYTPERALAAGLGNTLPLTAVSAMFVTSVMFVDGLFKKQWRTFVIILVFATYIIVISATRKALGALVIILIGFLLGKAQKLNAKTIMPIMLGAIVIFIGMRWVMNNTYIGKRINESAVVEVTLSSNPKINDFLMSFLGDRAIQYYNGIALHQQYPITGIGLGNYQSVGQSMFRFHTEYMVQYCENGTIGILILLFFDLLIIIKLIDRRNKGENVILPLFGLFVIIFINFTAWTYNQQYAMVMYAIILAKTYNKQPSYSIQ